MAKGYTQNWWEEDFVVSKIKNTVLWSYVASNLNGEKFAGSFYENELQKTCQEKSRIKIALKRKGDKLYVKWKGYDNLFNSRIDKKRPWMKFPRMKMSQYFPKPFRSFGGNINVKIDLSN